MIICPWCGTNYASFQPNCDNCGGSLPLPAKAVHTPSIEGLATPPPPPRNVPHQVMWRILSADGWAITGFVFLLLGVIFGLVGAGLTISPVTVFVGLSFAALAVLFLCAGVPILVWRYQMAHRILEVLEQGEAAEGEIVSVYQNYHVRVNGRYPWTVHYQYEVSGRQCRGKVTTLSRPDLSQQPGRPVYVLHMGDNPAQSTIYPSPYGYYGL
jgi:membrane protein implicated in regulation of membrane protease activity